MPAAELERRLERARQEERDHLEAAKLLVNQLRGFATDAVCAPHSTPELGPEADCVRGIEEIGRQIYGDSAGKHIWQALQATDGSELEGAVLAEREARVLLTLAGEKHQKLTKGCV